MPSRPTPPVTIAALHDAYRCGTWRPSEVVEYWLARPAAAHGHPVWISTVSPQALRERALVLDKLLADDAARALALPVFGALCAVKDNIDCVGLPTTAACPAFARQPTESAFVVAALEAGGAIVVGKANLDQFATGLVGTRSPYGVVANAFDPRWISGGSSSGSAVAVAAGLVHFALGTDTAGSGRVPAGLNNIVGWKPTRGLLSTRGVVPACRSLDCVSIFALTVADAARVFAAAARFDVRDPCARALPLDRPRLRAPFVFAVPQRGQREFYGDQRAATAFADAVDRLTGMGGVAREIDFAPWRAVAAMLYEGPHVAERHAAIRCAPRQLRSQTLPRFRLKVEPVNCAKTHIHADHPFRDEFAVIWQGCGDQVQECQIIRRRRSRLIHLRNSGRAVHIEQGIILHLFDGGVEIPACQFKVPTLQVDQPPSIEGIDRRVDGNSVGIVDECIVKASALGEQICP